MKLVYLLLVLGFSWSCSLKDKADDTYTVTYSDSVYFKKFSKLSHQVYSLDEKGVLKLDTFAIQLYLKEVANERYDLTLISKGQEVFSWQSIAGISKITVQPYFIMFTVWDTYTEDGANEGYAFLYDWHNGSRTISKTKFQNTSNPVYLGDGFYVAENLNLVKLDVNFNVVKKIPIVYRNEENPYDYSDTYRIAALGQEKNRIQISFSPQKSQIAQQTYSGVLEDWTKKIILLE